MTGNRVKKEEGIGEKEDVEEEKEKEERAN